MDRYRPGRGVKLAATAPCLYPGCHEFVTKRTRPGGLPTYFCSDSCRANHYNISQQLRRTEDLLLAKLTETEVGEDEQQTLNETLEDVRWHLARFPSIPERHLRTHPGSPTRTATEAG